MRSFDELLKETSTIHGHQCAGQILGVRMAMLGCREVGIDEPRGCKKLIVYAEMDRCATDAVQAVTGCSLGKRTLKFLDYGKMAITFLNTETGQAVRVLAKDDARKLVPLYVQDSANPREAQKQAYRIMPEEALFAVKPVTMEVSPQEMPGYRGKRVECARCGEGINFNREVELAGLVLCIPCSQEELRSNGHGSGANTADPKVLLIVGYKKVGKTTLIERLIPELSRRGYRVGTVKHHHSDFPDVSRYRGYRQLETSPSRRGECRLGDADRYRHVPRRREFGHIGSASVGVGTDRHCPRRGISRRTASEDRGVIRSQ